MNNLDFRLFYSTYPLFGIVIQKKLNCILESEKRWLSK